jgi:LPXTG-motif cell wall-anchored protein
MSLESSKPAGEGFNSGILLLMIIPYLLLAAVIWIFFRKKIKEKFTSILHRK